VPFENTVLKFAIQNEEKKNTKTQDVTCLWVACGNLLGNAALAWYLIGSKCHSCSVV